MILIKLPAWMECAEPKCTRVQRVELALMADGTMRPRPPKDHGWQVSVAASGAFMAHCPEHHHLISDAPAPKLVVQ